jgi:F0F1-type ATP synthase membrane subunit b/b'
MNEAFYVAISFVILVLISYKKLKDLLDQYLASNISKLIERIQEAESINKQAHNLFLESQNKLEEFVHTKLKSLDHAKENALRIQEEHKIKTNELTKIRKQDFDNYLSTLENACLEKTRTKIASTVHSVLTEAIKYEKFSISNKLN